MRPRLLIVLLVALLAACRRDDFRGANVVVIGIDTLRADHVGVYGYARPTTPRIDAFAGEAVRFETAISQSSWTVPGFASMFTGLVPSAHGAGEGRCPDVIKLGTAPETLASALHAAGYRTAAFVSNVWVSAEVGLARGFDEHTRLGLSEEAVDRATEWLRAPPREPFHLFVHVVDPHQPYAPDPEDARPFVDPDYRGSIGTSFSGTARAEWNAADRRRIVDLYDGEVRFADRMVGRLLDTLDQTGLAAHTIVVVISDHGEELFDHGAIGHGHTLYDELLRVPFLIRFPGGWAHGVRREPVRTMDLFPTLLDALERPIPAGLNGASLMPLLRGGVAPGTDVALSEYPCFAPDVGLQSLRTPRAKLLFSPTSGHAELFDLADDPHEHTDVALLRPAVMSDLRARLAATASAARSGFHLILRGGARGGVVRARLKALSLFTDVALLQGERGDRVRVLHDGRILDLEVRLAPAAPPLDSGDTDIVAFRTAGDLGFVLRSLAFDGDSEARTDIVLGNGATMMQRMPLPIRLDVNVAGMTVLRPMPTQLRLDGKPRLQLAFVQGKEKTEITPEMAERLRLLGYVR